MFVWRSEWSVTIGSPARARDFCSHTRSNPGQMSLPSSVQKSLSVLPSLSPRYLFCFYHQASNFMQVINEFVMFKIIIFNQIVESFKN